MQTPSAKWLQKKKKKLLIVYTPLLKVKWEARLGTAVGMVQEVAQVLKFTGAAIGKGLVKTLECMSSGGTAHSPGSPL